MFDKVLDMVKTKNLVVPGMIFFHLEELGLKYDELYVIIYILITCLPFLIIALIVAFFAQRIQIKWMITTKPLQPKLSKLSPISGFKRMFSKQAVFELIISIAKIAIFTAVSYSVMKENVGILISSCGFNSKARGEKKSYPADPDVARLGIINSLYIF